MRSIVSFLIFVLATACAPTEKRISNFDVRAMVEEDVSDIQEENEVYPIFLGFDEPSRGVPRALSTEIRVISWNLAGFQSIPDNRFYTLVQAIRDMDADIIALVEVNYSYVAPALAYELSTEDQCYHRKIVRQSARQSIAVIHKCALAVENPLLIEGSDLNRIGYRKALSVEAKAGDFDFVLITVHLKAGRDQEARQARQLQNSVIAGFIENDIVNNTSERDVLLVGDYNMIPDQDAENFVALSPNGFLNFISTKLFEEGGFTHIREGGTPGNFLDGYAISTPHTSEYVADSIEIIPLHNLMGLSLAKYRKDVSDHLPLLARFTIVTDDD